MSRPVPDRPLPGQESVWDYPRPPRLEAVERTVRVEFQGVVLAHASRALRVLETSHPPTYYLHPDDVAVQYLHSSLGGSFCEWKGTADYFDLVMADNRVPNVAWRYRDPSPSFADVSGHLSFYPALVSCFIDDEPVRPQPGQFYGGWVTNDIAGPFKGAPGSMGW